MDIRKKVPEIRFGEFDGEWSLKPFGSVFQEYTEKNHTELPALTIVQGHGTVLRDESNRNIQYDKENLSGYKKLKKGTL